jgi:hypothetical protein
VLLLGAAVLTAVAALRGAEYDEQYTMFLTAGVARPDWPAAPFPAGEVRTLQSGHAGLARIAHDLRTTDVHPPLYFWSVALWRRLVGGGLFAARFWSVLCGVAALAAVGVIARQTGVPPAAAMLLTLGCYGFAYTGAIARGFALAQALTLWGAAVSLLRGRWWNLAAGALLGAASFANYLAVFAGAVVVGMSAIRPPLAGSGRELIHAGSDGKSRAGLVSPARPVSHACLASPAPSVSHACLASPAPPVSHACLAALGMLPFLLGGFWFFVAQRNSRVAQFPPFHVLGALQRLARYAAANLFGGLPLYAPVKAQPAVAAAVAALAVACVALVAIRWRHIAASPADRRLLLATTAAPPAGLLLLGVAFHNTPIELRYLAFATPFAGLLLAGALGSLRPWPRWTAAGFVSGVQAAALTGLMLRPETMQPARATAAAASRLAAGGIVLLPRGNDGVGVVGAFAIESPPAQRLLVVQAGDPPVEVAARLGDAARVVLVLLAQDAASRAAMPVLRAVVAGPCWQPAGTALNSAAFERVCARPPLAEGTARRQ